MSSLPEAAGPRIVHGEIVDLTQVGDDGYEGFCHSGRSHRNGFGGSVLGHALAAAYDTVEPGRDVHSLHGYFLHAVDTRVAAGFDVARVRDGRSYSVRRVDGHQTGRPMFTMTASFKTPQPAAHERLPTLPDDAPGPEGLPDGFADRRPSPIRDNLECRAVPAERGVPASGELARDLWFRFRHPLGDDPVAHRCGLAYLSDVSLAPTAFQRITGPRPRGAVLASLDHTMWFHRPARADEWLLYQQRSRVEADGRTFARGELWTRAGELVASVAQEALMHVPDDPDDVREERETT